MVIMRSRKLNYKLILEIGSLVDRYQVERLLAETNKFVAKYVFISIINLENKFYKWDLLNNHGFQRGRQYQYMTIKIMI